MSSKAQRVTRTSPEARLERLHPVRFYLMRDDELWFDMVEQYAAAIQKDRSFSLLGIGERLYFHHKAGHNLLSSLEYFTFHDERLKKAFDEEYGGAAKEGLHNLGAAGPM